MEKIAYIGVDEVGRGAGFGPVTCAGCLVLYGQARVDKVRDSKAVKSEKVRQRLAEKIREAHTYFIVSVTAAGIDQFGIDACQNEASQKCVDALVAHALHNHPDYRLIVTVDGDPLHGRQVSGAGYSIRYIPKADATEYEVSAASLVAKVHRDDWVHQYVRDNPSAAVYNLDENKGYIACVKHRQAMNEHGLTPLHRRTFCRKFNQERTRAQTTTAA